MSLIKAKSMDLEHNQLRPKTIKASIVLFSSRKTLIQKILSIECDYEDLFCVLKIINIPNHVSK